MLLLVLGGETCGALVEKVSGLSGRQRILGAFWVLNFLCLEGLSTCHDCLRLLDEIPEAQVGLIDGQSAPLLLSHLRRLVLRSMLLFLD